MWSNHLKIPLLNHQHFLLTITPCIIRPYYEGWIKRRKEETAKRIDEIHNEVAKEEAAAAANSKTSRRVSSTQNLRRSSSMATVPTVDEDGFVSVQSRGVINRSGSKPNLAPPISLPRKPNLKEMRRSQSQPVGMSANGSASPFTTKIVSKSNNLPTVPSTMPVSQENNFKSPEECAVKAKSVWKEYFVCGDIPDAVLSFDELICAGEEGSIERGAKVVESGVLLVMEMKESDVKTFLAVLEACLDGSKIEKESLLKGLSDPLEFLGELEIDAPLAGNHLARIVAACMKKDAFTLDNLRDAPEYFRTGGKAATFAAKVLRARGGQATEGEIEIVDSLMTEDDRAKFISAVEMVKP